MFFAGLGAAISIKLSSSIDDVVWLAPFLTANSSYTTRIQNVIVYTSVCLIQTQVAMGIAYSGDAAVAWLTSNAADAWTTEKILTVTAGVLLAIYTVKLTYEYFMDSEDDDENEENSLEEGSAESEEGRASMMELGETSLLVKSSVCDDFDQSNISEPLSHEAGHADGAKRLLEENGCADEARDGKELRHISDCQVPVSKQHPEGLKSDNTEKKGQQTLFVIAFVGSLDDLTLFVPMLVGKGFNWIQLVSGSLIAASIIVMLCLFLGLCKPVANLLSSIPLAVIVGVFSASLLCKGCMMQ